MGVSLVKARPAVAQCRLPADAQGQRGAVRGGGPAEANDLIVGIMALVAQQEREVISKRTKEALAAAKARGVRLGNPNGAASLRRAGKGGAPLRAAIGRNADRHAQNLAPVVEDIRAGGAMSLRAIAAELNGRGILTRRGGHWHVSTVMNLLDRLGQRTCVSPG
jgi:DNA invertase Pin-like site-specific DNA recombinase